MKAFDNIFSVIILATEKHVKVHFYRFMGNSVIFHMSQQYVLPWVLLCQYWHLICVSLLILLDFMGGRRGLRLLGFSIYLI